ncbi:hypothetical protein NLG97_g1575 [Lecanicillium saksenae]|uniref:Uncharacterized protein n=1 Tax=Lecanicillium saksenae TaxID=468837 RepID=A0ACC1R7H3_9HYPO|nr:hypothetical protein NLG97_g1575 [Lecanicillium saksenae]
MSAATNEPKRLEPYQSEPLLDNADSIRLITVERNLSANGLISCQLKTTAFAKRPKYEALSYRWGDETVKKSILVNGVEMAVALNLFAALDYFRKIGRGNLIWIDALSIDQKNVAERTRQIQIMPHIYMRASTVVVWLGEELANMKQNLNMDQSKMTKDDALYTRVTSDEYWNRVWIRQEIGKARRIQLLLGSDPIDWERFMIWLRVQDGHATPSTGATDETTGREQMYDTSAYYEDTDNDWYSGIEQEYDPSVVKHNLRGPAVLDHLRNDKQAGSCTLRSLIVNNAEAHAKDARDKIYGLVGLSSDGRGFPMDYQKSLYEVWVDTVRFMNANKLLPNGCITRFKFLRTLRTMLNLKDSVAGVVNLRHAPANHCPLKVEDGSAEKDIKNSLMKCPGTDLGAIISLGPSVSELVASVELTDKWDAEVQRLYKDDLQRATKENDDLMEKIMGDDESNDLPSVSNWEHYRADFKSSTHHEGCWDWFYPGTRPALQGAWNHPLTELTEPRLAMIQAGNSCDFTAYKFAFVPPQARQGDFICRLYGYPVKDVLVRAEQGETYYNNTETIFHVCGTAVMVTEKDPTPNINHDEGRMFADGSGLQEVVYEFPMRDTFHVRMDATTMYAVMFGNEERDEKLKQILVDYKASNPSQIV